MQEYISGCDADKAEADQQQFIAYVPLPDQKESAVPGGLAAPVLTAVMTSPRRLMCLDSFHVISCLT